MNRVIITGATGVIGTALTTTLINAGIEVLIIARPNSKRNINIPVNDKVKIKYSEIDNYDDVKNDTGEKYDVFYHFAWEGTTGINRNDMYLQTKNIKHSLDAVKMAERFGCKAFIGAGSQAEYGRVEGMLKPDTPVNPEMGYGYAKLCAGYMTRDYAHQLGMQHVWVRILSVYGPNDGAQSMVMSTINKLKNGEVPQFTKGEQMWDYLFSYDAAQAFYLIGKRCMQDKEGVTLDKIDGKTYVLGSGEAKPLADYIRTIRDVVSPDAKIELGAIPYSEKQVMYLCADIEELQKEVAFNPTTLFDDGIKLILMRGQQ